MGELLRNVSFSLRIYLLKEFKIEKRRVGCFVVLESPAIRSYECSPVLGSQRFCIHTTTIGARLLEPQPLSICIANHKSHFNMNYIYTILKNLTYLFLLIFTLPIFAQDTITQVPEYALYYYYHLNTKNFEIRYNEPTKKNYQHYYQPNISEPYIFQSFEPIKIGDCTVDTLEHYIDLELVSADIIQQKIPNPYCIDPKSPANMTTDSTGRFCLPIQENPDTLCFAKSLVQKKL